MRMNAVVIGHHEYIAAGFPRGGSDRRQSTRESSERREADAALASMTQILAVADMSDALASQRSYKEPYPVSQIGETLRDQFTGDPRYVAQILSRLS